MKPLISLALDQRVLINLLFVLLIGVGVGVFRRLPVDPWPEVTLAEAWITTIWDGASPEDVERLVTNELEDEIEDISGVKRIVSDSLPGMSFIDVKFDEGLTDAEFEIAFNDLRAALDRATDLPEDAETPFLQKLTTSEVWPLFSIVLFSEDESATELMLREVGRELRQRLTAVPGVTKVTYGGYRKREYRVLIDRLAARRADVSVLDVLTALQRSSRSHSAGAIRREGLAPPPGALGGGEEEIRLRFDAEHLDREDIERAVVRLVPGASPIRVRDVARVEEGFEPEREITRMNGKRAIVLNIAKEEDSDTISIREDCGRVIDAFMEQAPAGFVWEIVGDQSDVVRSRFSVLLDNLSRGICLVAVILFFAVGLRNALIALVGVPFAYLCAFILFPSADMSINNLTLFGMVLVGGMLVDDAIVTLENIYRHVELGKPIREAVLEGASEVAWPVFNACLTTVAAMSPLLLQTGVSGKFFSFIPKVVILALIFSVVQCVTVLPVHYLDFGARTKGRKPGPVGRFFSGMRGAVFDGGRKVYLAALRLVLRFRLAFLALVLGGSVLLVGLVLNIPQDPWVSDFNAVFVTFKGDPSYSLEQSDDAARLIEEELDKLHRKGLLVNYYTIVGFRMTVDGVILRRPDVAFFMGTLADIPELMADPEQLIRELRAGIDASVKAQSEHRFDLVEVFAPRDGPPLGRPVAVRVESNDYQAAQRVAEEIKRELRTIEGVDSISDNFDLGPKEYRFSLETERASALGFFPEDAALALRAANDGLIHGSVKDRRLDEDVDVRVQYAAADRLTPKDLLDVDVRGTGAGLVPLGEIAEVDVWRPNSSYYHYDTKRTVLVTADVDGVIATGPQVNERLQRVFADAETRYPGVRLTFGGEFEETTESMDDQRRSFWVALVLIYVVLASQFRSFSQPFVVMAVVPFSVLGVLLGLLVRQQPFTIPTFIAIIGLAGVVVNESLMLVDFMNRRRREGLAFAPAILQASGERFRPIVLTACTTICNLLPLALGFGGVSRVWTPFAVSIVFGIGVSAVMTLFMVPVLYSMVSGRGAAETRADA